jgi:drug/metabolite transporter (DMT)-like permease
MTSGQARLVPRSKSGYREVPVGARRATTPAYAVLTATALIWASLHSVGKLALAEVSPTDLAFARVGFACPFLLGACLITGRGSKLRAIVTPPGLLIAAALGATGFVASSLLSMHGLARIPAGVNSMLANASPLMIAFASLLLVREGSGLRTLVGIVAGFVGVVILASRGGADTSALDPLGIAFSLSGAACWAAYTALSRRLMVGYDTIAMGAVVTLVATIPLGISVGLDEGFGRLVGASASTHAILLWSGLVGTAGTFTAWVYALRRIPAARVASFQYLVPLFALILAFVILGERPTPLVIVGALLIVGGVATANARRA